MKIIKRCIGFLMIFIASGGLAFFFENRFRKAIRALYVLLTNGDISFYHPKLDFHFASNAFVLAFGFFVILFIWLLTQQTRRQQILSILFAFAGFISLILIICYIDGLGKIVECTACNDGKLKLRYDDINYDGVFIAGLIAALIPALIIFVKNRQKPETIPSSTS